MPGRAVSRSATFVLKDEAPVACCNTPPAGVNLPDGLVIACFCVAYYYLLIPLSSLG